MRFKGLRCGVESEHVGGGHRYQDLFSPAGFFMCSRQQQRKGNSSPGGATFITDSMDLPQYSRFHWGHLNMTGYASFFKREINTTWKCTRKVTRGICRKANRSEMLHPIPGLKSVNSQQENTYSEWTQKDIIQAWWHMPPTSDLRMWRQDDQELKAILGYTEFLGPACYRRPGLKQNE